MTFTKEKIASCARGIIVGQKAMDELFDREFVRGYCICPTRQMVKEIADVCGTPITRKSYTSLGTVETEAFGVQFFVTVDMDGEPGEGF